MRKTIANHLRKCSTCVTHNRHPGYAQPGDMPIAVRVYPMQIVSMDLIGPLVESLTGNRYTLTINNHCSGWAEAYPLPDKTNKSVWYAFSTHFLSRHGVHECLITDNGGEFIANAFTEYLHTLGVEHHRTTPAHPASNGKCERFNRTLKELLQSICDNASHDLENKLGDALLAYRTSASSVTGYTPFYLLYGRRSRMPLTRTLRVTNEATFGNRLDDLARALREVWHNTQESHRHNRARLQRRANLGELQVGDSEVLKAEQRGQFTSRWDPHWEVTRINGPVIYIRNQLTGKYRPVNREKVRLVDPTLAWDEINPGPPRIIRQPRRNAPQPELHIPAVHQPAEVNHEDNGDAPDVPQVIYPDWPPLPDSSDEGDSSDEDYQPPQPRPQPLAHHSQPTNTDHPQPSTSHNRPSRTHVPSARARAAAATPDCPEDINPDPVVSYFRKRVNIEPAYTIVPGPSEQKKSTMRSYCIGALVLLWTYSTVGYTIQKPMPNHPMLLTDGILVLQGEETRAHVATWTVLVTLDRPLLQPEISRRLHHLKDMIPTTLAHVYHLTPLRRLWQERIPQLDVAFQKNAQPDPKRTRRGIFNFIGDISNKLFGTATEEQVSKLQLQIRALQHQDKRVAHPYNEL